MGDKDANTLQASLMTCVQSMRRSVHNRTETASACNCIGCGAACTETSTSDIYRCSVTHDHFLWVCKNCRNEESDDENFFFSGSHDKHTHTMSWAPKVDVETRPAASRMWTRERFRRLMQEDSTSKQATVVACATTVILSFFLLMLLRPPIVAWKRHDNEAPRLHMMAVIGWSVFAGVATLILIHTL